MRARRRLLRVAGTLLALGLAGLTTGCTGDADTPGAGASPARATPTLGGTTPRQHAVPDRPMDLLEKPVAARLAGEVADEGLSLDYLDCPHWDGTVPSRMRCTAYVDGLLAHVQVRLRAAVEGRAVGFDAWLEHGLVATRTLERTLAGQGWTDVDCGPVRAYPARVGARVVCHVRRAGRDRYVVATVTTRAGAVRISELDRSG